MTKPGGEIQFEILFDRAEPTRSHHEGYQPYGNFALPPAPPDRPWVYANFVQSLDGITSLLGKHASGGEISQSREDRWLMDLLRAHADGVLMGMATLQEERRNRGTGSRGIVFRVMEPKLRELRAHLGKKRERNIFVTHALDLKLSEYKVFDGEEVEPAVVTSPAGAARLRAQSGHSKVVLIAAGNDEEFDLAEALRLLRQELGIEHLLCEGGPTLYGSLSRAGLIDEKFLTIAPFEVGQMVPPEQELLDGETRSPGLMRPTIFSGPGFTRDSMTRWQWMSARKAGDHQFDRYRRLR